MNYLTPAREYAALPPAMGPGQRAGYYATQGAARLGDLMSQLRNIDLHGTSNVLLGNDFNTQRQLQIGLEKTLGAPSRLLQDGARKTAFQAGAKRAAQSGLAKTALRFAPITAAGFALGDIAGLVTDDVGLGNKAMDAAAMGIGGFIGSAAGPLGTAAGVSLGKMASDATQFVFGGGASNRRQEQEQLMQLLLSRGV